jgi:prophage regulatory protein
MQAISSNDSERILRWPAVEERVGICRSHAHALAAKGLFPRPIKLSAGANARASGWLQSEIDEWLRNRITESRLGDSNKAAKT